MKIRNNPQLLPSILEIGETDGHQPNPEGVGGCAGGSEVNKFRIPWWTIASAVAASVLCVIPCLCFGRPDLAVWPVLGTLFNVVVAFVMEGRRWRGVQRETTTEVKK